MCLLVPVLSELNTERMNSKSRCCRHRCRRHEKLLVVMPTLQMCAFDDAAPQHTFCLSATPTSVTVTLLPLYSALRASCRYVSGLVKAELDAGVPAERLVVGGFSQGGAVAMHALRQPQKVAGAIGAALHHLTHGFCHRTVIDTVL